MHKITSEDIDMLLASETKSPAVTLYIPTHRTVSSPSMTEDQIRFKNLCREAIETLESRNSDQSFIADFKQHCDSLLRSVDFWEHLTESLLICANPNGFHYFHLPIDSDSYVAIDDHFHLTPVIGLVSEMTTYYVLQVAQHNPQLLRGDMYDLAPADLQLPTDLRSALQIDEMYQKSLQFSSIKSTVGAMYHGHGGGKDTGDDERMRFWRLIDGMVCYDIDTSLPLILAGTDSELAEFRSVSKHPRILSSHIDGSSVSDPLPKLHEKSMTIIRNEVIAANHQAALERFAHTNGHSPGQTALYAEDLENAAEHGRVDMLLVGMTRETNDTVRNNRFPVAKLVFPDRSDEQTIDRLARKVFAKSGSIVNLFQSQMPDHKLLLAINRY